MIYFQITDLDLVFSECDFCAVSLSCFGSPQPVNLTVDLGTFQSVFVLEEHLATIAALRAPGVSPCSGHTSDCLRSEQQTAAASLRKTFLFFPCYDSDSVHCWKFKKSHHPFRYKTNMSPENIQSVEMDFESTNCLWLDVLFLTSLDCLFAVWPVTKGATSTPPRVKIYR